jgi:6-phosphogluconolactonase
MPDGAGPRHISIHPDRKWIYVINEFNSSVSLVTERKNGRYELNNSYSTLPKKFNGDNYCADIHVSKDGKFLYASNRGHNSIAIFKIDQNEGSLNLIGHEPTKGKWPRNFAISPDEKFIIVANQHSNNIVSFKRDELSGELKYLDEIECPTPVNILF